jgi:hypothetical protein
LPLKVEPDNVTVSVSVFVVVAVKVPSVVVSARAIALPVWSPLSTAPPSPVVELPLKVDPDTASVAA